MPRPSILRRISRWFVWLLAIYGLLYLAQWPFRSASPPAGFDVVAHRGVHQDYHRDQLNNETCTAERIDPPTHAYLENTLPSMQAAFAAGASAIEIDVHATRDGEVAVFHDWTVDCRTEGSGETRTHSLAELKALDAGYGYTADGGQSYPFRGQGVGLIPSLSEVLAAFPNGHFVLDQKDRSTATTERLIRVVRAAGAEARVCLAGTPLTNARFRELLGTTACAYPDRQGIKRCLIDYLASGWTGAVPESCRAQRIIVPDSAVVRLLWGWPGSFIERMRAAGSSVHVYTNDSTRLAYWRALGVDGLWTDHIERFASDANPGAGVDLGQQH